MREDEEDRRRVAIVHERFTSLGGSERMVEQLMRIWPTADLHAPIIDESVVPTAIPRDQLQDTWLRLLYRGGERYAHLLPLIPLSFKGIKLEGYDLIVTSHHAFAHRIKPPPAVRVVSYVHSPPRWMWEASMRAGEAGGATGKAALAIFAATQRGPDRRAAARPDRLLANSTAVAGRIKRHWNRDSTVVYGPVDVNYYRPDPSVSRDDFFLLAGRLVPYKRPELAAAAALHAGVRLVVAGDGRSRALVESAGGGAVEMLGRVSDDTLRDLYRRCRALIMPGVEDLGLVPVEAQACGAPVIAVGAGGVMDTVIHGQTGSLVAPGPDRNLVDAFARVLRFFDPDAYEPSLIRKHAEFFSQENFRRRIRMVVDDDDSIPAPPAAVNSGALSNTSLASRVS